MIHIVQAENILPISASDEGINVNFEGDSEDILNHPDSVPGHAQSVTLAVIMHPEMIKALGDLKEATDKFVEIVRRDSARMSSEFKRIEILLAGASLAPHYAQIASLKREKEEEGYYSDLERFASQLKSKEPIYIDEIRFLFDRNKKYLHWDHEAHVNPYSKKIKGIKVKGKMINKGRTSAQYFTLKATRKQNTSSVK